MKPKQNGRGGDQMRQPRPSVPSTAQKRSLGSGADIAQFKRILVPIDFTEPSLCALDYALALAERFNSELVLLHVVEPTVTPDQRLGALPETTELFLEENRERLQEIKTRCVGNHCRAGTLVRIGHAHSEIIDTANALAADLIVMPSHSNTDLKNTNLGSTAEKVIRNAASPVMMLKPPLLS